MFSFATIFLAFSDLCGVENERRSVSENDDLTLCWSFSYTNHKKRFSVWGTCRVVFGQLRLGNSERFHDSTQSRAYWLRKWPLRCWACRIGCSAGTVSTPTVVLRCPEVFSYVIVIPVNHYEMKASKDWKEWKPLITNWDYLINNKFVPNL